MNLFALINAVVRFLCIGDEVNCTLNNSPHLEKSIGKSNACVNALIYMN